MHVQTYLANTEILIPIPKLICKKVTGAILKRNKQPPV